MDSGTDWVAEDWISNRQPFPQDSSICAEFAAIASGTPDAIAVETFHPDGTRAGSVTYVDLAQRATALAQTLRAAGVRPGDRVALATVRNEDVAVGLLGVLGAGASYVPLDLSYPAERLGHILTDADIRTVVLSPGLRLDCELGDRQVVRIGTTGSDDVALPEPGPGDAAYVIYTSGSTGRPKGVVTPHRAVLRLTKSVSYTPLEPGRRILQLSSVAFDAATLEIWGALLNGGTCAIYPGTGLPDLAVLRRVLEGAAIETLWLTSSLFNAVVDADPTILSGVTDLLVGGEALSIRHIRKAQAAIDATIVNGYGPTEATTFACCHAVPRPVPEDMQSIPIGRPIENTAVSIRDETGVSVPDGQVGELLIAGPGLASGYLNRPDLTADRFVHMPDAPGERAYRSGDLVRRLPDGAIEFVGRRDGQVKIAGHRIELGEVEAVTADHPGIRSAAAAVHRVEGAPDRLAVWIVTQGGGSDVSTADLRRHLEARLPAHMIPGIVTVIDALPLTPSGKLDRAALSVPIRSRPDLAQGYAPPRGPVETFVSERWAELIGIDRVGRNDRFFELGGTSLMAMQFLEAFHRRTGRRIGVAAFFDAPTPERIARLVEDRPAALPTGTPAEPTKAISDRIAIVGLAGRFAGAPNVDALWRMLLAGRSGRIDVTPEDMLAAGEDPDLLNDPDYVAAAYPLDDAEGFDAKFFGMTPREVQIMDPQQRVFLEAAWWALEDAAIDPQQSVARIGVFGGVGRNAYMLNNLMSHPSLRREAAEYNMLVGNERDFPCTHVAFRLGLTGPAVTVQTACSTSGVAIHMAAESLRRGESDIALAGGAKVLVPNRAGYHWTEGGPLSPDGYIRAFDSRAGGMVRGSGVAMVAMRRLEDALADGDHVYAVLIGSAVNNDGQLRAGFTAPSVSGQAEVIAAAHRRAGIAPETVSLIEAHGTGTPLGDPIEVTALTRAFREGTDRTGFCRIGSIKTNIGHLDAGATAAGVIKAALSLEQEIVPPSLNFETPNPGLEIETSPFRVADTVTEWPRGGVPRRAGISSFGLGGTNAHLILEEAPAAPDRTPSSSEGAELLVISARTETALARRCEDLADHLDRQGGEDLTDVAHTLRVGRRRFERRTAFLANDATDAVRKLRARKPGDLLRCGQAADDAPVAFMFPGGGAQYLGMARGLHETVPAFRETLDACDAHHVRRNGVSLLDVILGESAEVQKPSIALPALLAVELAMGRLWMGWGMTPSLMIGHSMGEYAAACLAGVVTLEEAMDIVAARGRLFDTLPSGAMLSVSLSAEAVAPYLDGNLSISAINRPDQCVIGGPIGDIDALARALAAEGVETRRVPIDVAAHSAMVEPILDDFRKELDGIVFKAPNLPFVSNVTGQPILPEQATDPDYWVRHLRETVRFSDGLTHLFADPRTILLECGPGQTLSGFARQHPERGQGRDVVATIRHPREAAADRDTLLSAVGRVWLAGGRFDWAAFNDARGRRVPLPGYPFERTRHWIDAAPWDDAATAVVRAAVEPVHEAADASVEDAMDTAPQTRFERILTILTDTVHRLSGLPRDEIDIHATFLELGFDSLFLTQANAAFRKTFRIPLTTRQLLETTPTLEALATFLDETLDADAPIGETASPPVSGSRPSPRVEAASPGIASVRREAAADLSPQQEAHIDALIAETVARTPKAKAATQASRGVLADPRTVQGFRSRWKEMVYPILSDRAEGAYVWDIDGNRYVDLVGGYGVTFLGHRPDFVSNAIRDQIDRSLAIGPQSPLAGEVAGIVAAMTGMERVAFCNTGSEAVLAALRMARTATGRSKVAKFDGHYHGIFDEMQVRGSGEGSRKTTLPAAPGIPPEAVQNTIVLEYGDEAGFDVIRENAADLALVLVEPVRSRNPDFQPKAYLQALRRLTEELDIPLLFDEIVTGFRCHPGGAQAVFDVRADIATYGKVAGGGLPIGIVAGSPRFMDTLDGGDWRFGDGSAPQSDMTWFAGTFVRHPMALAATRATLAHLQAEGPALQERLNARAETFADDLNDLFRRFGAPLKMERFASVLRLTFTRHQEYADLLFFHLRNRGVMTYEGRPIFLSTAHTDADLTFVRDAMEDSLRALVSAGLLDGRDPDAIRRIPMAAGQQEIWVSARFSEEASCSYNLCSTLHLKGRLDAVRLREALGSLSDRHEALRALPDRDGAMQVIRPTIKVPFVQSDLADMSPEDRARALAEAKRAEVTMPFDLDDGPLIRAVLLRLTEDEHLLLLTVHHVIADGWSCGVLCRELGEVYAGREANLPAAPQLGDFVAMQSDPDQQAERDAAREYWLSLHADGLTRIEFPSDRLRPPTRSYAASRIEMPVESKLVADLRQAARDSGTTLFAALIGGFAAYVTRLTGQRETVVGFSAAGQPLMGGGPLVGHCVNFLPLRLETDLSGGFDAHLKRIGGSILDALEHQSFDFVTFVQETQPRRDADWAPLVTVGVNLDPSAKAMTFADLETEADSVGRAYENLDLFLNFVETDANVELQCTFSTALFDEDTIRARMREYLRLLSDMAEQPGHALADADPLDPPTRARLVAAADPGGAGYDRGASVPDVFRQVVQAGPDTVALQDAQTGEVWTYRQVAERSARWTHRLRDSGVGAGDRVVVQMSRSRDLAALLLAILELGAVYVPLEVGTPEVRLRFILRDTDASCLVSDDPAVSGLGETPFLKVDAAFRLPAASEDAPPATCPARGSDPAYIMYTSGSTGEPKGVVVPHRAITRLVVDVDYVRLDPSRRMTMLAPPSFDASTFEIWGALLNGASLRVLPGTGLPDLPDLKAMLDGIMTLWLTAGLFNALVDTDLSLFGGLSDLLIGGEALSPAHVARVKAAHPALRVINGYGPTEATTFTCTHTVPDGFDPADMSIPIGRPIPRTDAYVLDHAMRLLPPGVPGELVIGGDGLSLGYWNRPEETAAAFVPDTVTGQPDRRLYRSGDICRMRPDGVIEYLHRRDDQVKVRGFRIELGEVERALEAQTGVAQAAAFVRGGAGDGQLAAAIVPDGQEPDLAALRDALRLTLPRHLIPASIAVETRLPVTANGKLDRKALAAQASPQIMSRTETDPVTETEKALADIWRDLLERPIPSAELSFFDLGGHSLKALRLFDRIRDRFGVDLPMSTLFAYPSIRDLAARIDADRDDDPVDAADAPGRPWDTSVVLHPGPDGDRPPLFIVGGLGGNVNHLADLGREIGRTRPAIGFQARGILGHRPHDTIEAMAAENLRYMRRHQPTGPYHLAGYSAGAYVAFEMARQLRETGQSVQSLVILDTYAPGFADEIGVARGKADLANAETWDRLLGEIPQVFGKGRRFFWQRAEGVLVRKLARGRVLRHLARISPSFVRIRETTEAWFEAAGRYRGGPYDGRALLILSDSPLKREQRIVAKYPDVGWRRMIDASRLHIAKSDGNHLEMIQGRRSSDIATMIQAHIADTADT